MNFFCFICACFLSALAVYQYMNHEIIWTSVNVFLALLNFGLAFKSENEDDIELTRYS